MPLKKCSIDGKSGWKWGDQGHCYPGKEGKKKAIKQGIAIEGSPEKFAQVQKSEGEYVGECEQDIFEVLTEAGYDITMSSLLALEVAEANRLKKVE